jgi:hypothetical protein
VWCATGIVASDELPTTLYRDGLEVDGSGVRLAMGSTTGALWISDNGGECWELIKAHLPPIYAVHCK